MTVETDADLTGLRLIGGIVADCLQLMAANIEPGMTTRELDEIGAKFLADNGARSAPMLTYQFPGTTCISINHQVAHGIPGDLRVAAGDMVNIDVSAERGGYFADTGGSFIVPPVSDKKRYLCDGTRAALAAAMKQARAGQPLNGIGRAIEDTAKRLKLTVIKNLGSHGVGRALHEEPKFIAPFHVARDRRLLHDGMVITIEPFLSNGADEVWEGDDGWTLLTAPRYASAQFEHTLVIRKGEPLIMTLPSDVAS